MNAEFGTVTREIRKFGARWGVVLGSGLGGAVEALELVEAIRYSEIPGLPVSGVAGHSGRIVLARAGGVPVLAAQGRVHLYEGRSAADSTAGIRFLAAAGVERVVLTNAAGSLRPELGAGTWMLLRDHLNLTGGSPLEGSARFLDLTEVYSPGLRERFRAAAARCGLPLTEGVYAGMRGPQYETPAEVRMLRLLGADAVGMSTVLEAIEARAQGLEVAGVSYLSNPAAGLGEGRLDHAHVLEAGRAGAAALGPLLLEAVAG